MASISELKRDQDELKRLIQLASRVNVRTMLQGHIDELQARIKSELEAEASQASESVVNASADSTTEPSATSSVTSSAPKLPTKKITSYAWDQSDAFVKIYATNLAGIQKIPSQNVTCDFNKVGFNLMVSGLEGKNHQLQIVSLYASIKPEESKIKIKSDSVLVMLKKEKNTKWDGITEIDRKKKEKQKMDTMPGKDDDPQAGIMNMMKKMYEDGDEDMKRTIAKAWTESQDKKNAGAPMF